MRIALCSDERYPVQDVVRGEVARRGHTVVPFGAMASGHVESWVDVAEKAARAVASGACDEGVFFCWTGTGMSIAANRLQGIRAALCNDPGTAKGARIWNHANVLCLSNRLLSADLSLEILAAWFDTEPGTQGDDGVARLEALDRGATWGRS